MSMDCPQCSQKTSCVDSRTTDGTTSRRYLCRSCKAKFSTAEIIVTLDGKPAPINVKTTMSKGQTLAYQHMVRFARAWLRYIIDHGR